MPQLSGWEFSVEDGGRIRRFIVAEPDRAAAKALLQSKLPSAKFLRYLKIPASVISFFKMKRGGIIELFAAPGSGPLEARGTLMKN
jgi:hypothetical protein